MSKRREAQDARYRLQGAISRAEKLRIRSLDQVCDGDLSMVDRESAEVRLKQATGVIDTLTESLDGVERWLSAQDGSLDPTPRLVLGAVSKPL